MNLFGGIEAAVESGLSCHQSHCTCHRLLLGAWAYLAVTTLYGMVTAAPYGKFSPTDRVPAYLKLTMPARLGWFLQEGPAFAMSFFAMIHLYRQFSYHEILILSPFAAHYFNRSFLFPLTIKSGRPVPLATVVAAFLFCAYNGVMQSHAVMHCQVLEDSLPRQIIGALVFTLGLAINIKSDNILTSLRKPGVSTYVIPRGFLFEYVSCPNYLGECVEWWGWAVMAGTWASVWFAVFTTTFLGSRALRTHVFYKEKFGGEYPSHRRAIIPSIL